MIASGIQIGYAGAFAAHIFKYWPELAAKVKELIATAEKAVRRMTRSVYRRRRLHRQGRTRCGTSSKRWLPGCSP